MAGKRNTSGERDTSGRRDLSRTSSRSNVTRNITSTSNVTVQKRFTTGARRCLECEKIHDVDEQDVYRTCIGGITRVPDVHRRGKIPYGHWTWMMPNHVRYTSKMGSSSGREPAKSQNWTCTGRAPFLTPKKCSWIGRGPVLSFPAKKKAM